MKDFIIADNRKKINNGASLFGYRNDAVIDNLKLQKHYKENDNGDLDKLSIDHIQNSIYKSLKIIILKIIT